MINEMDINFDSMSEEELGVFLDNLREESAKRRPRMEVKQPARKTTSKAAKPAKNIIQIDLD